MRVSARAPKGASAVMAAASVCANLARLTPQLRESAVHLQGGIDHNGAFTKCSAEYFPRLRQQHPAFVSLGGPIRGDAEQADGHQSSCQDY